MFHSWWKNLFSHAQQGKITKHSARFFSTPNHDTNDITSLIPTAQEYASQLPDLLLASQKIAHTVLSGSHGYKRAGHGSQFWQYRLAMPGEPFQAIDWRQSAKSDKTYVRETEEENTQTLHIWCDHSGSMQWRSAQHLRTKEENALLLTIALSSLALNGGERVNLIHPKTEHKYFKGIHQLYALGEYLVYTRPLPSSHTLPTTEQIKPHAWTILISDFLYPYEEVLGFVKHIIQRPNNVMMIQIADPAEKNLPYKGRLRFTGLEGEESLIISNNRQSSEQYEKLWQDHQKQLQQLCHRIQIPLIQHTTDSSIATTLFKIWNILSDKKHLT